LEKRNRLLNLKSELLSVERQIQERLKDLEREGTDSIPEKENQTLSDAIAVELSHDNESRL
jgi:hypothetical protein